MASPFVKWAGSKRALCHLLATHLPESFTGYYELFAGGGSLFFHLEQLGRLQNAAVRLNDTCVPLIDTYRAVRDNVEELIVHLQLWQDDHSASGYYEIRDRVRKHGWGAHTVEVAATFIYLNRVCFNGLFRVNQAGQFNVPLGRYEKPRICDPAGLRAASAALQDVTLTHADFDVVAQAAGEGDLVYLDPPYVPVRSDSFVSYQASGFSMEDQERVAACVEGLLSRGAHVIVSNTQTPWVEERYAFLTQHTVTAPRNVAARTGSRKAAQELIMVG